MSKYSEFVKAHMAKHKMTWSCAVCEIKKENLYKKGKAPEKKARKPVEEYDPEMDMPLDELVAKDITSADKRVLPAPPVRIPHIGTLGSMPVELSRLIQDFVRPTEEMMNERPKKITKDMIDYAGREFKKYRKFKAIYNSVFELPPQFTELDLGVVGGNPDYLGYVKSELARYSLIFKEHIIDIEIKAHMVTPLSWSEPSVEDMRKAKFRTSIGKEEVKSFRRWLEKSVREAQLLKRSIRGFPKGLEARRDKVWARDGW
jgi:hypothetical protein